MKKIKTIIISAAFLVSGFILGTYITTTTAEQTWPLKIWFQNENGKMETYCLVDENTGVNYVVISRELYRKGIGTAITPRLNVDGSLYISK